MPIPMPGAEYSSLIGLDVPEMCAYSLVSVGDNIADTAAPAHGLVGSSLREIWAPACMVTKYSGLTTSAISDSLSALDLAEKANRELI